MNDQDVLDEAAHYIFNLEKERDELKTKVAELEDKVALLEVCLEN